MKLDTQPFRYGHPFEVAAIHQGATMQGKRNYGLPSQPLSEMRRRHGIAVGPIVIIGIGIAISALLGGWYMVGAVAQAVFGK